MRPLAVTGMGRRHAERLMGDECVIERLSTSSVFNEETLEYEAAPPEKVYEGKCRIHSYQPQESTPQSGDHVWTVQRYFVSIPVGAGPARVNDVIRVTGSVSDPQNVGRRFRVASTFNKTYATAQRLMVDEGTG